MVAADAEKLSKELVERAAAGRHQDVDRLLKDGADSWLQQITSGLGILQQKAWGLVDIVLIWSGWSIVSMIFWTCEHLKPANLL